MKDAPSWLAWTIGVISVVAFAMAASPALMTQLMGGLLPAYRVVAEVPCTPALFTYADGHQERACMESACFRVKNIVRVEKIQ
jgi:hypothetical protein